MRSSRSQSSPRAGFSLIEVIITIVITAIVGVMFLTYMQTNLINSGNPVNIARYEGATEMWMERIVADYVQEMNTPVSFAAALATIYARNYTSGPYNMPASVTLTRSYVTYDGAGNEVTLTGGLTSTNLKVTVRTGGYSLTSILTAARVTSGDSVIYY
jgi:prepilin-type N-terminal cleavage/methylation domain-containing protein